jgi:hypothetical protein
MVLPRLLCQEFRSPVSLSLESSLAAQPRELAAFFSQSAPPVWIDDVGNQRSSRMDPLMRSRVAPYGRTVQVMFAIGKVSDSDLTSVELSLAKDTKALVIERIPAPELVLGTQNRQSIFRLKVNVHCSRGNSLLDC